MIAESVTSRHNELRSLLALDVQGHQRGGFCIVPFSKVTSHGCIAIELLSFQLSKIFLLVVIARLVN